MSLSTNLTEIAVNVDLDSARKAEQQTMQVHSYVSYSII